MTTYNNENVQENKKYTIVYITNKEQPKMRGGGRGCLWNPDDV